MANKMAPPYSVPKTFRCHIGGEWKPLTSFAETQQHKIRNQLNKRLPIDAAFTGMTCREHQAKPRDELKCAFCSKVKHLSDYSKSSRKMAEPKCKMCVAWIEIQEPQVTPGILLNTQMSPDEERRETRNRPLQPNDNFLLNFEEHLDTVSALNRIGQPSNACFIAEAYSTVDKTFSSDSSSTALTFNPRGTREASVASTCRASSVATSGLSDSAVEFRLRSVLPPHLQAKANKTTQSAAPSSPSPSISSQNTSIAGSPARSFNGWDNKGNRYRQTQRQESVASSASVTSSRDANIIGDWSHAGLNIDIEDKSTVRRGWGKPSARLTAQELRGEKDWTVKRNGPFIKREKQ